MRKVIVGAFLSLDGVMQAPGGPTEDPTGGFKYGGWTVNYWADDVLMGQFMGAMFERPFDLLLGRKTYEIFAGYWPYAAKDDPIAESFNRVAKYVATSSKEPLTWNNSVRLGDDVAGEIARLKQGDGPDLLTQGSSVLLQTLLAHDLVDEFRLLTFPLILGPGKKLFGTGSMPGALKLVSSVVSASGVIMTVHQRDGAIKPGTFQSQEPSAAEVARQARMKREG